MSYKPTFIRLPLHKMAGCPWNLLDDRGMRIAWCGTDNNHEKDGELIANDILNLVAIAEAVSELLEKGNAKLAEKDAEIERLRRDRDYYRSLSMVEADELDEAYRVADGLYPGGVGNSAGQIESAVCAIDTIRMNAKLIRAENERLRKALEQACDVSRMKLQTLKCGDILIADAGWGTTVENAPELAAYLRERDSRPPGGEA